jgi:hypothetical protein
MFGTNHPDPLTMVSVVVGILVGTAMAIGALRKMSTDGADLFHLTLAIIAVWVIAVAILAVTRLAVYRS